MTERELVDTLIQTLIEEQRKNDVYGVYAWMQIETAYQSNKIEGCGLTRKQVASIFKNGEIIPDDNVIRLTDIEEVTGHFVMFDEMLKTLDTTITNNLIRKYHLCFRNGISQNARKGSHAGEYYKQKDSEKDPYEEVKEKMNGMISTYNERDTHSLESLAKFHAIYEEIMPFESGSSRVGRILLIKESLKSHRLPLIVHAANKETYKEALKKAQEDQPNDLIEFFQKEQINFERELNKIMNTEGK